MDLYNYGHSNEVSGSGGGGNVHTSTPEYCHPVYYHLANTGAMFGGGLMEGVARVNDMVGAGWP